MKIAVFGATGLVGGIMLKVLEERNFPVTDMIPIASERSAGSKVAFRGREWDVVTPEEGVKLKPDFVLLSAGSEASLEWAPKFAENGAYVIDNSSAWRMDNTKKLIIPEINGDILTADDRIIANPNCSTIQMLMVLAPIHREYRIKRVVVSTYQAVTGTGVKAIEQLDEERAGKDDVSRVYPHQIDLNCLPQCDDFTDNGYTKEEMKLVNETHKILDKNIVVSPTAVRVPVMGGHSESINIEVEREFDIKDVKELLSTTAGVVLQDDPTVNLYPMPITSIGRDEVFVGRIRRDVSHPQAMNLWVVADNLRKGAATNSVQIAELVLNKSFNV